MCAHISVNSHPFGTTYPVKGTFKIFLTFDITADIVTPFLYGRILRITKYPFCRSYKRAAMDCISAFLVIERHTSNINCLEPFLYFSLSSFANKNHEL